MKGRILDYSVQNNTGSITGADGERYYFSGSEWKGAGSPTRGMSVDFESEGKHAKAIFQSLAGSSTGTSKSKVVAGLLAIFLGTWGIHKFYLGFTGPGLVFLLVNTIGFAITWIMLFIPNWILGLIAFIEGIIYLTKSDEEFEQVYVVQKRSWF
jgi:TM2 domain-containing membrane protein YozV